MTAGTRRRLDETRHTLQRWLGEKVGVPVTVSALTLPKAGFSNETIVGTFAPAGDGAGVARAEGDVSFVLRIQPTDHQVFQEADAMFQSRMMRELGARGLPVPTVLFEETDPAVLGSPFFVMEKVEGRIPPDTPGWHTAGWAAELAPDDQRSVYENGLAAVVHLHAVDATTGFEFLELPGEGSALDRYLQHVQRWYEWSAPSRRWGTEVIDAALEHVLRHRPDDRSCVVTWGDARVGNIIFDEQLSVAAMLDWEGAALGPPGIDVGWWLMFEEYYTGAQGVPRLAGVPGHDETAALYVELGGVPIPDVAYYEIVAGLVFSLINSRLADLFIARGADPANISGYVTRVTGMVERWLDVAT